MLRSIGAAMRDREFESTEELQAFLNSLVGQPLPEGEASTEEEAQELAYQAMEAFPSERAIPLAREALALDASCTDAHVVLAKLTSPSQAAYIEALEEAVRGARAKLGDEMFQEDSYGHFWGITETRPYMRACLELALALWQAGREAEACTHLAGMLELNTQDNQGVRGLLVGWSLATGDIGTASRVLEAFGDGVEAVLAWGRVLERWLADDEPAAEVALEVARKLNPSAEKYFNGTAEIPEELPDSYSPGRESEAITCGAMLGPGWLRHPQARLWLRERQGRRR
jgi:tetratricopeptide (TPR) repeat protein